MRRKPVFEKIGCYFKQGDGVSGFQFFKNTQDVKDGDFFVYNRGILFGIKKGEKMICKHMTDVLVEHDGGKFKERRRCGLTADRSGVMGLCLNPRGCVRYKEGNNG